MQAERVPVFRVSENGPPVIRRVLLEKGWIAWEEGMGDDKWHIHWKSGRFKPSEYTNALSHQRVNHFPKSGAITRKDMLLRNIRKMRAVYGSIYNIIPVSFILPNEYTKFIKEYTAQEGPSAWICKPSDLSRGQKIFIFSNLNDLVYDQQCVLQRYIERPLLIGGYKQDLRLYVVATSFHPMEAYLYCDGLVRFSTEKYNEDLTNLFSHLTNSSINKYSPTLNHEKDVVGAGCKWDFIQFKDWMVNNVGEDRYQALWGRIRNVINLTLLILTPVIPNSQPCFELFGFDILIDQNLTPVLIEVNCSPALGMDCDADNRVKIPLLSDLMELLNIEKLAETHYQNLDAERRSGRQNRINKTQNKPNLHSQSKISRGPSQNLPTSVEIPGREEKSLPPGVQSPPGLQPRGTVAQSLRDARVESYDQSTCHASEGSKGDSENGGSNPKEDRAFPADHSRPNLRADSKGNGKKKRSMRMLQNSRGSSMLPPSKRNFAQKFGNFELLFPFNEVTEHQSSRLSRENLSKNPSAPTIKECTTAIVNEIKECERKLRRLVTRKNCMPAANESENKQEETSVNSDHSHSNSSMSNFSILSHQSEKSVHQNRSAAGSGFKAAKLKSSSTQLL